MVVVAESRTPTNTMLLVTHYMIKCDGRVLSDTQSYLNKVVRAVYHGRS